MALPILFLVLLVTLTEACITCVLYLETSDRWWSAWCAWSATIYGESFHHFYGPNSIIFACEMRDEQFEIQRRTKNSLRLPLPPFLPFANVVFTGEKEEKMENLIRKPELSFTLRKKKAQDKLKGFAPTSNPTRFLLLSAFTWLISFNKLLNQNRKKSFVGVSEVLFAD